jgi:hypothetical protein
MKMWVEFIVQTDIPDQQALTKLLMPSTQVYGCYFPQERLNLPCLSAPHPSVISTSRHWIERKYLPICKFSDIYHILIVNFFFFDTAAEMASVMAQHVQPGQQSFIGSSATRHIGWRQQMATILRRT